MVSSFASFEFRRWVVACCLTVLVISLQVVQAARATGGGGAAARPDDPAPGETPAAVAALLVPVDGTVVAAGDGLLGVQEARTSAAVSFMLGSETLLTRDGAAAAVDDLRTGDRVRMTVDGRTGRILQLRATGAPGGWAERLDTLGPIAALALILTVGLLAARRWQASRALPRSLSASAAMAGSSVHAAMTRFGRERPVALRRQDRACGI
jgi:hypothetical protein